MNPDVVAELRKPVGPDIALVAEAWIAANRLVTQQQPDASMRKPASLAALVESLRSTPRGVGA